MTAFEHILRPVLQVLLAVQRAVSIDELAEVLLLAGHRCSRVDLTAALLVISDTDLHMLITAHVRNVAILANVHVPVSLASYIQRIEQ